MLKYYSLNNPLHVVDFREATINGQAPDKGLYFPTILPSQKVVVSQLQQLSKEEVAFEVIKPYVADTITDSELQQIVSETVNFDIPLVPIHEGISSLELFHGPTLAFKDVGARFMSRCLGKFVQNNSRKITVLVATSGDTGGAVANGFYDVDGVDVVILYPSGKVSNVQEKQLTTLGKNITALEVNGSFDDCQQMVKDAFLDQDLKQKYFLTSANSINVARWLPQQFYYFFALQQWQHEQAPIISVPCGNFGNICAGVLAHVTGLPVKHFIAACNANDVIPKYLETGIFESKASVSTMSNAMDVAYPSNFVRIMQLFRQKLPLLKHSISSVSITDEKTKEALLTVLNNHQYLCDPHGAVAYKALELYLNANKADKGFILETAHPIKFYDVVEPIISQKIEWPKAVQDIMDKPKESVLIEKTGFKSYLMDRSK